MNRQVFMLSATICHVYGIFYNKRKWNIEIYAFEYVFSACPEVLMG